MSWAFAFNGETGDKLFTRVSDKYLVLMSHLTGIAQQVKQTYNLPLVPLLLIMPRFIEVKDG